MKKKNLVILLILVLLGLIPTIICILFPPKKAFTPKQPQQSGAGIAMDDFHRARAYPNRTIDHSKFEKVFQQHQLKKSASRYANTEDVWEAIGPKNFGGRMIGLAFNPQNPNTIYGGSATGGLWRTHTSGIGATAWEYIPTGFPVLGVMAIAINPTDSNEIYIGTGEVYYYQNVGVGIGDRTSRGTYGIGILKSTDNGTSWAKVLDWDFGDLKGVNDLLINPENPNSVWAATSEGLFVSYDAGENWTLKVDALNATDIVMHPTDTNKILVACGNFASENHGIYRSLSGGNTFTKMNDALGTNGLPTTWSGKVMMDYQQNEPYTLLASIGDTFETEGLYVSTNNGGTWEALDLVCDQSTGCDPGVVDYARYQGWFSHDVAIHPNNADEIVVVGVEAWKSFDGGETLDKASDWWAWDFSATPIGGPEGPPNYCHADIHRVMYHPTNTNEVYYATDGGLFVSQDGGLTFEGRNGNLQTQQFYADFSNSAQDSLFALGGLQDNSTTIYEGNLAWRREIGGDGLSTAIDPNNDNIVFGSSQYLNIRKSTNKAQSFSGAGVPESGLPTAFAGPYAMCQSNTSVMYAGRSKVFRSNNAGGSWSQSSEVLDGNPVLRIAIAHNNCDVVYACTAPTENDEINLFKSTDGGQTFDNVTGNLPERFILDIVVHPENDDWVYVALGGYDTQHIFKSEDGAQTWQTISEGLPDLPVNSIVIDTVGDNHIYIGNDIGVYASDDDGGTWNAFDTGLPDAVLAMDVSISPLDRRLRVATHGSGVYQRPLIEYVEPMDTMPEDTMIVAVLDDTILDWNIYPNPVSDVLTIDLNNNKVDAVRLYNINGQLVKSKTVESNFGKVEMDVSDLPAGQYQLIVEMDGTIEQKKVLKQ